MTDSIAYAVPLAALAIAMLGALAIPRIAEWLAFRRFIRSGV